MGTLRGCRAVKYDSCNYKLTERSILHAQYELMIVSPSSVHTVLVKTAFFQFVIKRKIIIIRLGVINYWQGDKSKWVARRWFFVIDDQQGFMFVKSRLFVPLILTFLSIRFLFCSVGRIQTGACWSSFDWRGAGESRDAYSPGVSRTWKHLRSRGMWLSMCSLILRLYTAPLQETYSEVLLAQLWLKEQGPATAKRTKI